MEQRLIDADWLLSLVCGRKCGCSPEQCGCEDYHECEIGAYIKESPTIDAVPVVRCGECKHLISLISVRGEIFHCGVHWNYVSKLTDFCSYGERKENSLPAQADRGAGKDGV